MFPRILFTLFFGALSAQAQDHNEWTMTVGTEVGFTSAWDETEFEYALTLGAEIELPYSNWTFVILPGLELSKTTLTSNQWAILPMPSLRAQAIFDHVLIEAGIHTHYEAVEIDGVLKPAFQSHTHLVAGWHNDWLELGLGGVLWPTHLEGKGIWYAGGIAATFSLEWGWGGTHALVGIGKTFIAELENQWPITFSLGVDIHLW